MDLNLYKMNPSIYDQYIDTKIEKTNFDQVFELIKKEAKNKNGIEILDLCCGTGIFPRKWLLKLKNVKYLGVDINKNFIRYAKDNLKNNQFQFVVSDAITFNINKKFDIVLATSSYHHIKDNKKRNYIKNVCRHMRNEGKFIVYEKMLRHFSNKIEAVDSGTKFYLERIKYMMKTEKLNDNQIFALFNEQYLTSIRKEEYKVDLEFFKKDIELNNLKIVRQIKLWPKNDLFNDKNVGDFVFVINKT